MKTITYLALPFLLAAMVPSVLGIQCFNCSTYDEPDCALVNNNSLSRFLINCKKNEFCRKTVVTIIDSDKYVRMTRSCGFVLHKEKHDNCYETDDAFKFERSCQCFSDGCNASATLQYSVLVMLAAAMAAAWFRNNH